MIKAYTPEGTFIVISNIEKVAEIMVERRQMGVGRVGLACQHKKIG
jgi:hypothetical protein